jgi:hypothetical protein
VLCTTHSHACASSSIYMYMLLPWYFIRSLPPNHPLFSCKGLFSTKSKKKILEIRWISNIDRYFCYFFVLSHILSSLLFCVSYKDILTAAKLLFVFLRCVCVCARAFICKSRPSDQMISAGAFTCFDSSTLFLR